MNYKSFTKRKLQMTILGFGCGLPLPLVFSTTVIWLKEMGFSLTAIGFISSITLLYALKFIWAPLCDSVLSQSFTRIGLRKSWIGMSQLAIVAILIYIGHLAKSPPAEFKIIASLFILSFFSTVQDMSVDAWRIEAPHDDSQGSLIALYQIGYRISLLISSSLALIIADDYSWSTLYWSMAMVMTCVLFVTVSLDRGIQHTQRRIANPIVAIKQLYCYLSSLVSMKQIIAILLIISLYRLCDVLLSVVSRPLFIDLGYTKKDIGIVNAFTIYLTLLGSVIGAVLINRIGLYFCLLIGAGAAATSNLAFLVLLDAPIAKIILGSVLAIDNLCTGIASTALIAWMSNLTDKDFTATHFAVMSSLTVFFGKLLAINTGWFAELYGYNFLFISTVFTAIPVLWLLTSLKSTKIFETNLRQ